MVDAATTADDRLGLRVFIVEDETLIMMLLEDILGDIGCNLAGSAMNLRQALVLADTTEADVAILDINLGGEPIFPVAESLRARGIPFVFASGYGSATLPEAWKGSPTLPKPFSTEQVAIAIRAAFDGRTV